MKKALVIVVALLTLLAMGWVVAGKFLRARGYTGTGQFLGLVIRNYPKSLDAKAEALSIEIDETDYDNLVMVVEQARERGVILPEGNLYVPAQFTYDGEQFKGRLRIKGKLTDHVDGRKWSFRVIGRKGGGFLGMERFSLQHPGTRNYLYEWLYHQIMRREGVIALKYGLADVTLNGEHLGIYAYEEHFGQELLQHNQRSAGPILRFDPGLYWIHRLHGMDRLRFYEAYAEYQAAAVDAYDGGDILKDSSMFAAFRSAMMSIERFRRGQLKASEVFDVDLMARRHAIIDLIGGHHGMDWSDVKFYFDPATERLEPVAYESFSVRPLTRLAGSSRFRGRSAQTMELHDALFNDEAFFRAYIQHLERVADPAFIASLTDDLRHAIDSMSAILYKEFPYKELDLSLYERNRKVIAALLKVPQGMHAYVKALNEAFIDVQVVPITDLPIEVGALLTKDGTTISPANRTILPARTPRVPGDPLTIRFPRSTSDPSLDKKDLKIQWSILGASRMAVQDILPFAFPEVNVIAPDVTSLDALRSHPFVDLDLNDSTVHFRNGIWALERDLIVPIGFRTIIRPPFTLKMKDGVRFIAQGQVDWRGDVTSPIRFENDGAMGASITIRSAQGLSKIGHAVFQDLGQGGRDDALAGLVIANARVEMEQIQMTSRSNSVGMLFSHALVAMENVHISGGSDQLISSVSDLRVQGLKCENAQDDAVNVIGGTATLVELEVFNAQGIALKAMVAARIDGTGIGLGQVDKGIEAQDGSSIELKDLSISGARVGVEADRDKMIYGPVHIELSGLKMDEVGTPTETGEGSTILIDGERASRSKVERGT